MATGGGRKPGACGTQSSANSHHREETKTGKKRVPPPASAKIDESRVDELVIRQREREAAEKARIDLEGELPRHTPTKDIEGSLDET